MKESEFNIYFEDGSGVRVWDLSMTCAAINAMSERIKAGKTFQIDSIEDEDGNVWEPISQITFKLIQVH